MKTQSCCKCGHPSLPSLAKGQGPCQWHWTAGNWGTAWALAIVGSEPKPMHYSVKEMEQRPTLLADGEPFA